MAEPLAYLNGRILPISQATLPVFDLGLVMGATVTEMARTFALRPYRLREHVDRLWRSIRATGIAMDHAPETLVDLASELVELNGRLIPPGHDLGVSLFVTAGTSATHTGLVSGIAHRKPTVCVHTFPLAFELYAPRLEAGLHLVTTSVRALPADCVDPRIKCRSRMHWYLADEQARLVDRQAQAILADADGFLTETSSSNFCAVFGRRIVTPREGGVLRGISLDTVAELAAETGCEFAQGDLTPYDVWNADEAFCTSTPACVVPVTRLNSRAIGEGVVGPVAGRLLDAWSNRVGLDIAEQIRVGARERMAAAEG